MHMVPVFILIRSTGILINMYSTSTSIIQDAAIILYTYCTSYSKLLWNWHTLITQTPTERKRGGLRIQLLAIIFDAKACTMETAVYIIMLNHFPTRMPSYFFLVRGQYRGRSGND
jgi:hypothetical protein